MAKCRCTLWLLVATLWFGRRRLLHCHVWCFKSTRCLGTTCVVTCIRLANRKTKEFDFRLGQEVGRSTRQGYRFEGRRVNKNISVVVPLVVKITSNLLYFSTNKNANKMSRALREYESSSLDLPKAALKTTLWGWFL